MIENENILCVTNTTWEGPYTKSVVQLMSLLAINNKVLFVEYPFTIKDVITTLTGKQRAPIARMFGWKNRLIIKKTAEGSEVYNWVIPPIIPVNAIKNEFLFRWIMKIDSQIYQSSIKSAMRRLKMASPISINAYNPLFGEYLIGKLNEKLNIYYCYDGFLTDRRGIRAWHADRSFSSKVNGIIVTSDYLMSEKIKLNPAVATVKNGVDFEMFNREAKTDINPLAQKRKIGYIGSIDQRFDLDLVEYSVRKLTEYDFEFIGDVRNMNVKNVLEQYPNVRFLPPVKPSEVPERLSKCDVGIIPYTCTEINKNIYPLKINEYLAIGVPVVITRFADLTEFSDHVSFASSKEEFMNSLIEVIENDNAEKIKNRIEFARSNSWKARAMLFSSEISSFLKKIKGINV
jgi:teichuronic acid biosynthesis glycosyltransferase TuaH